MTPETIAIIAVGIGLGGLILTLIQIANKRFDAIDRRLDAIDRRFDAVDGRLNSMDGRIDSLQQQQSGLAERQSRLEGYDGGYGRTD